MRFQHVVEERIAVLVKDNAMVHDANLTNLAHGRQQRWEQRDLLIWCWLFGSKSVCHRRLHGASR
jgi:hypothetical protein